MGSENYEELEVQIKVEGNNREAEEEENNATQLC